MEIDQDELDPNMIDSMEVDALSWEVRDRIELAREKAQKSKLQKRIMLENLKNLKGKGRVIEWELNLQITSSKDHLHKMRACCGRRPCLAKPSSLQVVKVIAICTLAMEVILSHVERPSKGLQR